MSVIIIGVSHHSAPIALLESLALTAEQVESLAAALVRAENLAEAVVLATCNRLEVYAAVHTFHGAVSDITDALVEVTGMPGQQLKPHLYVHYDDRAIAHAFTVSTGLDSMAIGDNQIIGQLRDALRRAQRAGRVGRELNTLLQHALRVGKRAHAETGLDRVSVSLVEAGLAEAARRIGPLREAEVLVVGAGAMSSLAAQTVARAGCTNLVVTNRTEKRGRRLADLTGARHVPLDALTDALGGADVVFTCTGAVGHLITADQLASARRTAGDPARTAGGPARPAPRPLLLIDLALPRDVGPACAGLPGVQVIGLSELGELLAGRDHAADAVQLVRDLVTSEVAAYLAARRVHQVAPTVAALRYRASQVMATELTRLEARLPNLSEADRAEVRRGVHRVVDKLLHTPTVRVKELVGAEHAGDYAQALRELFDLDLYDVAAVSTTGSGSTSTAGPGTASTTGAGTASPAGSGTSAAASGRLPTGARQAGTLSRPDGAA